MKLKLTIFIYLLGYLYSIGYGYISIGYFSDRVFANALIWPVQLVLSF